MTCERGREAGCVPQLYELFNEVRFLFIFAFLGRDAQDRESNETEQLITHLGG